MKKTEHKTLTQLHEDVPSDHYDRGYKYNIFQKFWHTRRIAEIKKIYPNPKGNIADIGCHSGFLTAEIVDANEKNLYGLDISPQAIKVAKKRLKNGTFVRGDAHALPYKNNFFDVVYCLEMLEHVNNPELVLREIKRVLKKNGKAIILVPTDNLLFRIIWYFWNIVYPVWNHTHVQSFQADSLEKLLKKNKFTIDTVKRFNLNMLLLIRASK